MKAREIIEYLDGFAPRTLAEEWDNVGFQLGDDQKDICKILIALDLDLKLVERAKEEGVDMIITHHPLIFSGLKDINNLSYDGRLIMEVIKNDIVYYCAHTNLDLAKGGVNTELGRLFKLKNPEVLSPVDRGENLGYGVVGEIEELPVMDLVSRVKQVLDTDYLSLYGEKDRLVTRLALVGGSGSDFIVEASKKADVLITGDIKYHDGQLAHKLGLTVLDPGHFHTEKIVLPVLEKKLKELSEELEISIHMESSPTIEIV